MKRLLLGTLAYAIPTMVLGYTWHFNVFPEVYAQLGIYNREPAIIPLGFGSMILQGIILSYLYPRFYRGGNPSISGLKFGVIMGLFMYSISTLANAAKMQVSSIPLWMGIQLAFHAIQFGITGPCIGLVYGQLLKREG